MIAKKDNIFLDDAVSRNHRRRLYLGTVSLNMNTTRFWQANVEKQAKFKLNLM